MTIGETFDPSSIKRTYEDIEDILHSHKQPFKTFEEKTPQGTFKSYVIEG